MAITDSDCIKFMHDFYHKQLGETPKLLTEEARKDYNLYLYYMFGYIKANLPDDAPLCVLADEVFPSAIAIIQDIKRNEAIEFNPSIISLISLNMFDNAISAIERPKSLIKNYNTIYDYLIRRQESGQVDFQPILESDAVPLFEHLKKETISYEKLASKLKIILKPLNIDVGDMKQIHGEDLICIKRDDPRGIYFCNKHSADKPIRISNHVALRHLIKIYERNQDYLKQLKGTCSGVLRFNRSYPLTTSLRHYPDTASILQQYIDQRKLPFYFCALMLRKAYEATDVATDGLEQLIALFPDWVRSIELNRLCDQLKIAEKTVPTSVRCVRPQTAGTALDAVASGAGGTEESKVMSP